MKTRYIIALAACALIFAGCQRELLPESDVNFGDGQIRYSVSNVGVKSSADDVFNTGSLSLVSGDGKLTVPVTCEVSEGIDLGNVSAETKGALINTSGEVISLPDGNKFTVSAYKGSTPQFIKKTATNSGTYWTMDPPQYWPLSTKLTFFAFANTGASSVAVNADATAQTLTYTVPSDAAEHQDILLGYYTGNGGNRGIAEIHFGHPLTAVMFKQGDMPGVTGIKSISLSGLAKSGTVTMDADVVIGDWTITGDDYTATATLSDGELFLAVDENTKLIGGKDSEGNYNGAFLLIQQALSDHNVTVTAVLTTADGDVTVCADITSGTWQVGKTNTYTLGYTNTDPILLPGKFSVSATEYVQFSKGNLFCTDKGSGNYEFSFEEKQYDYRCRNGATNDEAVINGNHRETPASTSGLFQWLTSNSNAGENDLACYGAFSELTKEGAKGNPDDELDYGGCMGPDSEWHSLKKSEMDYIINTRANAAYLKRWGTVCGVNGLLLAPDVETTLSAMPAYLKDYATDGEWKSAASANGLVFLPAAGFICLHSDEGGSDPVGVNQVNSKGYYYSSSSDSGSDFCYLSYYLTFSEGDAQIGSFNRSYGRSVRLVQKTQKPVAKPYDLAVKYKNSTLMVCWRCDPWITDKDYKIPSQPSGDNGFRVDRITANGDVMYNFYDDKPEYALTREDNEVTLISGETYYYKVTHKGSNGLADNYETISFTFREPPYDITVKSGSKIALSWKSFGDCRVMYKADGEEDFTVYGDYSEKQCEIEGLLPGAYTIGLCAINGGVVASDVVEKSATAHLNIPENITMDSHTQSTISLSWDDVSYANSYSVKYGSNILTTTENSIDVSSLSPDTQYNFQVKANINTDGTASSFDSNYSESFSTYTLMKTPVDLKVNYSSPSSAQVTWDKGKGTGGNTYDVYRNDEKIKSDLKPSASSSITDNGPLTVGQTYIYKVVRKDTSGRGNHSEPAVFEYTHNAS